MTVPSEIILFDAYSPRTHRGRGDLRTLEDIYIHVPNALLKSWVGFTGKRDSQAFAIPLLSGLSVTEC